MTPTRPGELEAGLHVPSLSVPAELHGDDDQQQNHDRIDRLTESWPGRANVRKPLLDLSGDYNPALPDFLPQLLPFYDHPLYQKAPESFRQAALSCGWIAYNEKTVAIESKIVSPACMHLIDGDLPRFDRDRHRDGVSQALVDEAYHILLVVQANNYTRRKRKLQELTLPSFDLVRHMGQHQEKHPEGWKKILIQLATSVVSEVMVSDYLRLLSGATGIQPLNRLTTEIHRRDESAHNGLFKSLGAVIYHGLSKREREFFVASLAMPSLWFASPELDVWEAMLQQIGFPGYQKMIADCRAQRRARGVHLDLSTLETLFEDLGVEASVRARAFPE